MFEEFGDNYQIDPDLKRCKICRKYLPKKNTMWPPHRICVSKKCGENEYVCLQCFLENEFENEK